MNLIKHLDDFKRDGWGGVFIKIKNRIDLPIILNKVKQINQNPSKSILIINGAQGAVSEIHRVYHLEDKLRILNTPYVTVTTNLLNKLQVKDLLGFNLLYIHRSDPSVKVIELINSYHNLGKKVIYDIDDLIFDQDQIKNINFLKHTDQKFRKSFIQKTNDYLRIIKMSDLVITPTDFLSEYIKNKYHISTKVLHNHLDQNSLNQGKNIYKEKQKKDIKNQIIIGYFPGTKTHQIDFETIKKPLFEVLKKHPSIKLKIVGELSTKDIPENIKHQIFFHQRVPYKKLMSLYSNIDINLAPLEINNDFCEAKSELKYFFAGACGIPTIATDTKAFRHAIINNKNGFLCKNEKDWKKYLNYLIKNKNQIQKTGDQAFRQVHQEYTPKFQAKKLFEIIQSYLK